MDVKKLNESLIEISEALTESSRLSPEEQFKKLNAIKSKAVKYIKSKLKGAQLKQPARDKAYVIGHLQYKNKKDFENDLKIVKRFFPDGVGPSDRISYRHRRMPLAVEVGKMIGKNYMIVKLVSSDLFNDHGISDYTLQKSNLIKDVY